MAEREDTVKVDVFAAYQALLAGTAPSKMQLSDLESMEVSDRWVTHSHTHSLTHSLTHSHTHIHTHTHTHTQTHTHTHTQPSLPAALPSPQHSQGPPQTDEGQVDQDTSELF